MHVRKIILFVGLLICSIVGNAQIPDQAKVKSKGVGADRNQALQDALRNSISQAMGVYIKSNTAVENFALVSDAIATHTEGFVTSYNVLAESSKNGVSEAEIEATVSLKPLQANAQILAKQIGGVRFLTLYTPKNIDPKQKQFYDLAVERINEGLANRNYRYIEKSRFDELQKEAIAIFETQDTSRANYIQQLGLLSGAQFVIYVSNIYTRSRSESFDTRTAKKVIVEVKAYDNCTAEGLGTVLLESDWNSSTDSEAAMRKGIEEAIGKQLPKLLYTFNSYLGNWVNNGTPFEIRFYNTGSFRTFRNMRTKMKEDTDFGGQFEIVSVKNYTKINCTYKSLPDDLAYKLLDFADAVPELASKKLDVKLIYGRQINIAPEADKIKELETAKKYSDK